MGAYRKLHFWKKFIESFLIHAVDISTSIHPDHNVVVVGPLGWFAMGNLRCFSSLNFPLLASIWLTTLSILTLGGGFGCLTPFSSMWVSSVSWDFEQSWLAGWPFSCSGTLCGNVHFVTFFAFGILGRTPLSQLVFMFSTSHALVLHPWGISRVMTRNRISLLSRFILSLILSISSVLLAVLGLVLTVVICIKVDRSAGIQWDRLL